MQRRAYRTRHRKNQKRDFRNMPNELNNDYHESRHKPSYTQRSDIVDYIDEDPPIPGQVFACVSFANIDEDQKIRIIKGIANDTGHSIELIKDIVNRYEKKEKPRRAFKVRGVYRDDRGVAKRQADIERFDKYFHVFRAEVGYWQPSCPSLEDIEDEEYQEREMNELMKGLKLNKLKSKQHFEQRKRDMVERAILEGTPEGQELLLQQEEPREAVEFRVSSADEAIEELKEKIKEAETMKIAAQNKLKWMDTEEEKGRVFPTLDEMTKDIQKRDNLITDPIEEETFETIDISKIDLNKMEDPIYTDKRSESSKKFDEIYRESEIEKLAEQKRLEQEKLTKQNEPENVQKPETEHKEMFDSDDSLILPHQRRQEMNSKVI